jgi:hypothetical protein
MWMHFILAIRAQMDSVGASLPEKRTKKERQFGGEEETDGLRTNKI